jgi:hypothetical protein
MQALMMKDLVIVPAAVPEVAVARPEDYLRQFDVLSGSDRNISHRAAHMLYPHPTKYAYASTKFEATAYARAISRALFFHYSECGGTMDQPHPETGKRVSIWSGLQAKFCD